MIRTFILIVSVFSALANAQYVDNHKDESWSVQELRRRFEVRGEVFVFDGTGTHLIKQPGSWNIWKTRDRDGKIENLWTSGSSEYGTMAIQHKWQVQDDGTVKYLIEQFGTIVEGKDRLGGPSVKDLVKKEEKVLENMQPVLFVISETKDQRVVVRFTPSFAGGESPKAMTEFPISGSDVMITDNEGYVWADHITHEGKYSGFSTHRGTLFISYYPFPGGKELGIASGTEMELRLGDNKIVTLHSKTDYLPQSVQAKVYGVYFPDRKSKKFSESGIMDRGNEKEFVERISHWPN